MLRLFLKIIIIIIYFLPLLCQYITFSYGMQPLGAYSVKRRKWMPKYSKICQIRDCKSWIWHMVSGNYLREIRLQIFCHMRWLSASCQWARYPSQHFLKPGGGCEAVCTPLRHTPGITLLSLHERNPEFPWGNVCRWRRVYRKH